jgi:hypothetical protein
MKLKPNIAISETGFVFNPATGESFTLNPIGAEIVNKISEGLEYAEISVWIKNEYFTDEATFERDFHDFIGQLKMNGLLEKQ